MGGLNLPNVCQKNGRVYYRRKEGGKDYYLRLPPIDAPGFAEAYQRAKGRAEREIPKAGTPEFQTLDPLTEKVIASWLRDLDEDEPDLFRIAERIEAGEHRRQHTPSIGVTPYG